MKKMFSCMLLLLISMTLLLPVYAAFENPPIIDDAGYLMQSELAKLSEELEQIRENYTVSLSRGSPAAVSALPQDRCKKA